MHVYLGADHRGYQLKNDVINWLVSQQIPYTDFGATEYDTEDDFNDYAKKNNIPLLVIKYTENVKERLQEVLKVS